MPRRKIRARTPARRAIIDIGSNTVRLVIYGGPLRAPEVLHNEKVTARLGKGVAEKGMLTKRASQLALNSLARYRALLQLMGVDDIEVVATAAARDALNGEEFLDKVRAMGLAPRLLSGEQEAVTSAHGVIGAFPGATGIVGDMGGGSLELVDIDHDDCQHGVSLPIGSLRLPQMRAQGDRAFGLRVAKSLKGAQWDATPGSTLYLVGGSFRAFARHAMAQIKWPVDDPHGFELPAPLALRLAKALARRSADTLLPVAGLSGSRLNSLPDTAALLAALVARLQPEKLIFSAWGLREGLLWEKMSPYVRQQDPLVAGVSAFAEEQGIAPHTAAMVAGWTARANRAPGAERRERLRLAATMLCLAATTVEPNLRADLARDWALRKRWIGASSRDRGMLAAAMIANTGKLDLPPELGEVIQAGDLHEAQAWGLGARLCRRLSGCTAQGLSGSSLAIDGDALVLTVQPDLAVLVNDGVQRDLKALATHLGLTPEVR